MVQKLTGHISEVSNQSKLGVETIINGHLICISRDTKRAIIIIARQYLTPHPEHLGG